eukprot:m.24753 g.24753  ORF g.24753 m.24753 type:complete len:73 (+) comp5694_c0_seq1:979-1197(+)
MAITIRIIHKKQHACPDDQEHSFYTNQKSTSGFKVAIIIIRRRRRRRLFYFLFNDNIPFFISPFLRAFYFEI